MPDLCDDPRAVPIRRSGYMDHTVEKGRRMLWQFWFADGSSMATKDTKKAIRLGNRMMKAGLVVGEFGDEVRAAKRREEIGHALVSS